VLRIVRAALGTLIHPIGDFIKGGGPELTIDTAATFEVMNAVMPRPLRIQYAGARYHLMSRGDRREAIFYDDADRVEFLRTLGQACLRPDGRYAPYHAQ
jgi:hypothetical protein